MRQSPVQKTVQAKGLLAHKYSGNTVGQPIRQVQPARIRTPSPITARGPPVPNIPTTIQKGIPARNPVLPAARSVTPIANTKEEQKQTIDINLNINVNAGSKQDFNINVGKQNAPKGVEMPRTTPVMQHHNHQIRQPVNLPIQKAMQHPIQRAMQHPIRKASPPKSVGIPTIQRIPPQFAPGTKFVPMVPMVQQPNIMALPSQQRIEAPVQTDPIDYVQPKSQLWKLHSIIDNNEIIECIICHEVYGVMDTSEHVARHRRVDHRQPLQMSKLNHDFSTAEMRPIIEPEEYIIKPVQNIYVLERINKGGRSSFQQVQQPVTQVVDQIHVEPEQPMRISTMQTVPQLVVPVVEPPITVLDTQLGVPIGGGGPNRLFLDEPSEDHFINGPPVIVQTPKQSNVIHGIGLPPANTILDNYGIAMHSSGRSQMSNAGLPGAIQPGALNQLIMPSNLAVNLNGVPIYEFEPNVHQASGVPPMHPNMPSNPTIIDQVSSGGLRYVQSQYNGNPPPVAIPAVSMANSIHPSMSSQLNHSGHAVDYNPTQFNMGTSYAYNQSMPAVNHQQLNQLISSNGVNPNDPMIMGSRVSLGSRVSGGSRDSGHYAIIQDPANGSFTNLQNNQGPYNQMHESLADLIANNNGVQYAVPPVVSNSFVDQLTYANHSQENLPQVVQYYQPAIPIALPVAPNLLPPSTQQPAPEIFSTLQPSQNSSTHAQISQLIAPLAPSPPKVLPTIQMPPVEANVINPPPFNNLFGSPEKQSQIIPPQILPPPIITSDYRPQPQQIALVSQPVLSTIHQNSVGSHKSGQSVVSKLQPQATISQQQISQGSQYNYGRGGNTHEGTMHKSSQRTKVPMNVFATSVQK